MIRYYQSIQTLIVALHMWLGASIVSEANNGFKWETKEFNGLDYVTLRSIKEFYYFDDIRYGSVITLEKTDVQNGGASRQPTMQNEWCFVCSQSQSD